MSERERINFNAPSDLVTMADALAELRGVTRTALLTEALEAHVSDVLTDETVRERLRDRYLTGELDRETATALLDEAEVVRLDLLQRLAQQDLPAPETDVALPSDAEFYGGTPPTASRADDRDDGDADESGRHSPDTA